MSPDYAHVTDSIQHLCITYNTLCLTNSVASYRTLEPQNC